jgi:hypothetical protein
MRKQIGFHAASQAGRISTVNICAQIPTKFRRLSVAGIADPGSFAGSTRSNFRAKARRYQIFGAAGDDEFLSRGTERRK